MPVVHLSIRGWDKAGIRGVVQPCILVLQIVTLLTLCARRPDVFDLRPLVFFIACLPASLAGTLAGIAAFRRAVLAMLALSGVA